MTHRTITRRGALGLAAGAVGSLAATRSWAGMSASGAPDSILLNGKVHTVAGEAGVAEAFAVRDGRFLAVGDTRSIKALAGRNTQIFDAQGMSIVPGFIDCHNHAVGEEILYETVVGNPFEVQFFTIAEIIERLRNKAQTTPPGYWVEGHFYDDTKVKDGRALNVHDLDAVSSEHPVAVHHRGGHTAFYNSKALQLAGITRDTPDPPGGTLDRDAGGALNGRVTDRAMELFASVGQRPQYTEAQLIERSAAAMAYMSQQFVRYGITGVHHEHFSGPQALRGLQAIRERGELKHRVYFAVNGRMLDDLIESGVHSGFGDAWLRIGGTVEHTADGSFSERTMALSRPYPGTTSGYRGNVTETQEELDAWVLRMQRAGMQVNCHANGDVAIAAVLTALERAQAACPVRDARPQITHCTLVDDDLVRRIKAIGAVPAPFTTYAYYNADKFHFYGAELMRHCMAYRSFIDAGVIAAAGSDFPPGPFAPLMGIQGMVTRKGWNGETWGPEQRISVAEALRINTWNGAYASHEEGVKGSIAPGRYADYVVLAQDPHTIDPERIKDIKVVRTVTDGRIVYEA